MIIRMLIRNIAFNQSSSRKKKSGNKRKRKGKETKQKKRIKQEIGRNCDPKIYRKKEKKKENRKKKNWCRLRRKREAD